MGAVMLRHPQWSVVATVYVIERESEFEDEACVRATDDQMQAWYEEWSQRNQ